MNIKITKNINEANLITHEGKFHPDDVFSTVFLSKIVDNPIVCRTKGQLIPDDNKAIVYDIGFGEFDHHGPDARYRDNSPIKYSSFGLLWEKYGPSYTKKVCPKNSDKLYQIIIEKLILQIDGIDNGLFPKVEAPYKLTDLDKIIDLFNNTWEEKTDNDENFVIATTIAENIFDRIITTEISNITASEIIETKIDTVQNNILILDEYMPYSDTIFDSNNSKAKEIKIVILPSNRGGYNIKPMKVSKDSSDLIVNFPLEYRGLHDEELAQISHIKTARFIHSSGFLACTETLEDAILLAETALNNKE